MGVIDVDVHLLAGARAAMRNLEADERKKVAAATRSTLTPAWQRLIRNKVTTRQQRATFGTAKVNFSAGGKGTLVVWDGRGMSGVRARDLGKPGRYWMELVDYGSRRTYGRDGRLPPHTTGGRITRPSVRAFSGYAAQVWLWALAESLREVVGVD